jgi:hypothetical protein
LRVSITRKVIDRLTCTSYNTKELCIIIDDTPLEFLLPNKFMREIVSLFPRDTPFSQSVLSFIFLIQSTLTKVLITPLTNVTNPSQDIHELHYFSMIK